MQENILPQPEGTEVPLNMVPGILKLAEQERNRQTAEAYRALRQKKAQIDSRKKPPEVTQ